ncbi:hypothetical protein [uncultured Roseobacter sp.]|uniref:hypothetical protein n=1 Tax=uncultured Roseobacter sp. TaxID=114847 RepID=UPI00261D6D66|nr:hypothetical protein [uncultured Roseobacter sp.]
MFRYALLLSAATALCACGGSPQLRTPGVAQTAAIPFASGPIANACLAEGRRDATRARCGCIQAAADQTLSQADQQRGVPFFREPGKLQVVRQSDARGNERFWEAWSRFADHARAVCSRT